MDKLYLYLCDGKEKCHLRSDGKENPYCKGEVEGIEGCFYTSNKEHALHKNLTDSDFTRLNDIYKAYEKEIFVERRLK